MGDPDKYAAIMMAPSIYREKLFPLYAFNCEIGRIAYGSKDPAISEIKLNWWKEELSNGYSRDSPIGHEIMDPLLRTINSEKVPVELFLKILEARRFDLYNCHHKSLDDQVKYIRNIFSSLFEISLRTCVSSIDENALDCMRDYGFSYGVANLFTAVGKLERLGRKPIYLGSQSELRNDFGYNRSAEYQVGIRNLADLAITSLMKARSKLSNCDSNIVSLIYFVAPTNKILKYVRHNPELVITGKATPSFLYTRISLEIARLRKFL